MTSFWESYFTLFEERSDLLLQSFWEHLQLSLISLLIAVAIAIPIAILLTRYTRYSEFVIGIAAVLQTIPSLALLGFLVLFVGIGITPAIVALTAYALLPILRNTYTGIKEVDPALIEAAKGMGMNGRKRLLKVELPLAMPTVMAGIRTSMVLIVGTATLAALVGGGGLGQIIMLGIQRTSNEYILFGALPAALLALFFDFILRFTERRTKKKGAGSYKPIMAVVVLALLIVLVPPTVNAVRGVGQADIVIGGKMGPEPPILANMYKHLIEQETDLEVEVIAPLGTTSVNFNALEVDDIAIYPEFTGTVLADLLNIEDFSYDERESYEQARDGIFEETGDILLEPMGFQNTYALAMPRDLAEELEVETISDLAPYANELDVGFTFEFADREDGYGGFEEVYGFEFDNVTTIDVSTRYQAISNGSIQLSDVFSTDPQIVEYDMVVLEDDATLFPPYQAAPLVSGFAMNQYPELEDILNQLAGIGTEDEISELNYRVDINDEDPADVAREFLQEKGLLNE
ncbi:ABC transporter permease/substrate-binding protein [Alkalihalobacillus sp. LMS6]|uniref:ABC transporter permease/substrate-binding protein n=1 Tax=Alkalihalobacillus sp. LMS6 TaxID=2924034 RepID=UPI0020D11BC6|nr:ABC transporter permease/substrate-binding protein [Alkalihalobacillus sp. LMS6]UTR08301.1 ABC transporter permease/substrate-binding protein [Alkalihalobacillus sp. LMS6]